MKKKQLIKKLAIAALIVAGVSLLVIVSQFPYRAIRWGDYQNALQYRVEELKQQNQEYAAAIAEEVKQLPPNPALLSRIESEFLSDSGTKRYLWMMNADGNFIFGTPPAVFTYMNDYYNQYDDVILSDRIVHFQIYVSQQMPLIIFHRGGHKERPGLRIIIIVMAVSPFSPHPSGRIVIPPCSWNLFLFTGFLKMLEIDLIMFIHEF